VIAIGVVLVWAGYGVGSYGWVLIKGYNIPVRQWFSPIHPWQWPAAGATVPTVPLGHIFPTASAAPGATQGQAAQQGQQQSARRPVFQ
jgi:hypothetical protein